MMYEWFTKTHPERLTMLDVEIRRRGTQLFTNLIEQKDYDAAWKFVELTNRDESNFKKLQLDESNDILLCGETINL